MAGAGWSVFRDSAGAVRGASGVCAGADAGRAHARVGGGLEGQGGSLVGVFLRVRADADPRGVGRADAGRGVRPGRRVPGVGGADGAVRPRDVAGLGPGVPLGGAVSGRVRPGRVLPVHPHRPRGECAGRPTRGRRQLQHVGDVPGQRTRDAAAPAPLAAQRQRRVLPGRGDAVRGLGGRMGHRGRRRAAGGRGAPAAAAEAAAGVAARPWATVGLRRRRRRRGNAVAHRQGHAVARDAGVVGGVDGGGVQLCVPLHVLRDPQLAADVLHGTGGWTWGRQQGRCRTW